jgi:hypothetical protein
MESLGLKKEPGITIVEHDGVSYEFRARTIPQDLQQEIKEGREEVYRKLTEIGHKTNTSVVSDDVDEEEKKQIACLHSEKSAIIFKLGRSKHSHAPIKIFKNLRICADCHEFTKDVSKVYQREVWMQDKKRVHIMKNGVCSCGDVW